MSGWGSIRQPYIESATTLSDIANIRAIEQTRRLTSLAIIYILEYIKLYIISYIYILEYIKLLYIIIHINVLKLYIYIYIYKTI